MKETHSVIETPGSERGLMEELSKIEDSVDEQELKEMLAQEGLKQDEENKQLVIESEGESLARIRHNRLVTTRFVLEKMLSSGAIKETTSFNRATGILDVMLDDLKTQDNGPRPPQNESEGVRPGYNTPYVTVCLHVLDDILKDNSSLGFSGQTQIKEFINFIDSEIEQLKETLLKKENNQPSP